MKSRNLTQISLQNDPINRRMHGFSFRVSEDENWSSRCEFFFLFQSNLDFIDSMGVEMSQEQQETNGAWNDALNTENLMNNHGLFSSSRRIAFKRFGIGHDRWSSGRIAINGRDETWIDWNVAIVSGASDRKWMVQMRFHRMEKERHRFRSPNGFWSNARDVSRSPLAASDLSRYNSRD